MKRSEILEAARRCVCGEGDFICDKGPGQPVLVVEDWQPNENAGRCRRGTKR